MYLLSWRRHGGLQYIGMSQDVDRRINAHRKAGRLPFAPLGDPAVEVLHFGLDVYAACDAERREIIAQSDMEVLLITGSREEFKCNLDDTRLKRGYNPPS